MEKRVGCHLLLKLSEVGYWLLDLNVKQLFWSCKGLELNLLREGHFYK